MWSPSKTKVYRGFERGIRKRLLLMGLVDFLYTKIKCTATGKELDEEICNKWRKDRTEMTSFHVGDSVEGLEKEYQDNWIKTDYICHACSKLTQGGYREFVKTDDQVRHACYVLIENSVIKEVLNEEEFMKRGITEFYEDL